MNAFYKIIRGEDVIVKIKKKSDITFWQYHILGLLSLFTNNSFDYLFITNKRILIIVKDEIIKNIEYQGFEKIVFNSLNDTIKILNNNKKQIVSLKKIRLTYEEIQLIKNKLNA